MEARGVNETHGDGVQLESDSIDRREDGEWSVGTWRVGEVRHRNAGEFRDASKVPVRGKDKSSGLEDDLGGRPSIICTSDTNVATNRVGFRGREATES